MDRLLFRFVTIHAFGRQTDRRTDRQTDVDSKTVRMRSQSYSKNKSIVRIQACMSEKVYDREDLQYIARHDVK